MTDAAGGSPPGGISRSTWPVVGLSLAVVGLLAGGGIVLASGDAPTSQTPGVAPSAATGSSGPAPTVADAQLVGPYDVRLVVRAAHNLATLAGIDAPVPGMRHADRWHFFPTCSSPDYPCPVSWEGREPPLTPVDGVWAGMVEGPPAMCRRDRHVAAPIGFQLRALEGEATTGGWVVQSFSGTWTIAFRCPGFAPSRGTVEITGHRR